MARAKKTDRAEARRRYRALAADGGITLDDEDESEEAAPSSARAQTARPRPAPNQQDTARPPGLTGAFRGAYRTANIREDLLYLPTLLRSRPVLLLSAGAIALGLALLVPQVRENPIALTVASTLFLPPNPPLIPAFAAGFFAQRAGYLAGGIVGLVCGLVSIVLFLLVGAGDAATQSLVLQQVGWIVVTWPFFGVFVGGFAAFYRRFLRMTGPRAAQNRSRRATNRPRGR